jgi:hypothetical protein
MRSDAVTCSDAHKKAWQRQRAKMLHDVLPGPPPDNQVSRDVLGHSGQPGPSGMSDIGMAGVASRRLNRARNGSNKIIPGGQYGVYDMRPPGVIPQGTGNIRASDDIDWARLAESDEYRS